MSEKTPCNNCGSTQWHGRALTSCTECGGSDPLVKPGPGVREAKAIRDRDELWCRCLLSVLDPRESAAVLKLFNENRPDSGDELQCQLTL